MREISNVREYRVPNLNPTEQMRTFHAKDVAEQEAWKLHSPMWRMISSRFYTQHAIDFRKHVKSIIKVNSTINAGFDFVPVDAKNWAHTLRRRGFQPDTKEKILGILPSVGHIAAMATHGEGFREDSEPSLHCAVAKDYCNVHLDNIPIRLGGNYIANAPQHTLDELFWQDMILPAMLTIGISPHLVDILRRVHPVVPNLKQVSPITKELQPRYGVELDLVRLRNKDATKQLRILIDFSRACTNSFCRAITNLQDKTYNDDRLGFTIEVTGL